MGSTEQIAPRLANFIAGSTFDTLPEPVVERVKKSILDVLGCGIYGASLEQARAPIAYARNQPPVDEASLLSGGQRVSASVAALVNGTFVHTTELAEGFTRALVHPGNVIVPAVLAVAERDHRSGADVLTATSVAYEMLIRLGLTCGLHLCLDLGLHPPAVLGSFGATAAVARVSGFDEQATAHALGIVACHVPTPLLRAADQQATVKDVFQGNSAVLAIHCAELTKAGITGLHDWVTPWYHAIPRESDLEPLLDQLGSFWHVSSGGIRIKTRPVMAMAQPATQAMYQLLGRRPIDHRDVVRITVESSKRIELGRIYRPDDLVAARASIPFLVAAALVHPDAFLSDRYMMDFLQPELLADEAVHSLADTVELLVDAEFDHNLEQAAVDPDGSAYMKFEARVTLWLRDGTSVDEYADMFAIGTGRMSRDEVADKFFATSERVLSRAQAEDVVATVWALEELADASDLLTLATAGRSVRS